MTEQPSTQTKIIVKSERKNFQCFDNMMYHNNFNKPVESEI